MIQVNADAVVRVGPLLAPFLPVGSEHEVVDDQLASVLKELAQRLFAAGTAGRDTGVGWGGEVATGVAVSALEVGIGTIEVGMGIATFLRRGKSPPLRTPREKRRRPSLGRHNAQLSGPAVSQPTELTYRSARHPLIQSLDETLLTEEAR